MKTIQPAQSLQILLTLVLASQINVAALAAENVEFKAEQPAFDLAIAQNPNKSVDPPAAEASSTSSPSSTLPGDAPTTTLNGSIHRTRKGEEDGEPLKASVTTNSPYSVALKKLSAGLDLTKDEYRALGIGVLGYENERTFYTKESKITAVYPGCPIDLAGIEVGDVQLEQHVDDSKVVDPTRPVWMFTCGVEGEAVDLKIKHRGHVSMHHVVRINMEDIPDDNQRLLYEQLVKKMAVGAHDVVIDKPEGVFTSTGE